MRLRSTRPHSTRLLSVAALAIPLFGPAAEMGSTATLVRDIGEHVRRTPESHYGSLASAVSLNGSAYFLNDDGIHGRELWRSDGTVSGTGILADTCPGSCGSAGLSSSFALAVAGDLVYFAADDGKLGVELWATDGSLAGTRLVRDIAAGLRGSGPGEFIPVGDRVYFLADDGAHGREIWVSDGSTTGTRLVLDLSSAPNSTGFNSAAGLGELLLFGIGSGAQRGLWRSDGTAAGTFRISTVMPWQQNWADGAPFAVLGERLVFRGDDDDGNNDPSLWVTDGTPLGTVELAADIGEPSSFVLGVDELYLTGETPSGRMLFRTDGTPGGTQQIALPPGVNAVGPWGSEEFVGSRLFFVGEDAAHGRELWVLDSGTASLVFDLRPGPESGLWWTFGPFFSVQFPALTGLGNDVLFFADDGVHGRELWRSDGTAAGTVLVADLSPGPASSWSDANSSAFRPLTLFDRALFRLSLDDAQRVVVAVLEGSAGATIAGALESQTSSFAPRSKAMGPYSNPWIGRCFAPLRSGFMFNAGHPASGLDPWYSEGTAAATARIVDLEDAEFGGDAHSCRPLAGRMIFEGLSNDVPGGRLLATDGSPGDLELLTNGGPETWSDGVAYLGDRVFYGGSGGVWTSDGTAAGTSAIPFSDFVFPISLGAWSERLAVGGSELYRSSEDFSSLDPVADLNGEDSSWPLRLTQLGDRLLFFAWENARGLELWASDGTEEGTQVVREIRPGAESAILQDIWVEGDPVATRLVPFGARALFAADDGLRGEELWVTDGTFAGTELLADLVPGTYPSSPRELTRIGDWVYFVAESTGQGRELWRTNGLPGGTALVADLVAGPGSSIPQELTAAGSELYFSAWTPEHGREPWRVRHGVPAGEALVRIADVAPGPLSSSPIAFLEVGGAVFFPANDNTRGFELWSVREADAVFSDGFESSGLAVWSAAIP